MDKIIDDINKNKDNNFFSYYMSFMQYCKIKKHEEYVMDKIFSIIGEFKYSLLYNPSEGVFEFRIWK